MRHHADDFGIDPECIGVTGVSSGGHLSLMLAATGDDGDPAAADPIDRQPSRVQAAAAFCPVTDLLNLTGSTQHPGDGGPPVGFVEAFGPDARDMPTWRQIGRELSPIYHVEMDPCRRCSSAMATPTRWWSRINRSAFSWPPSRPARRW